MAGNFGSAPVTLVDLAEQGAQIEHPQPLRLATKGRLWFKRGDVSVSLHAFVVWSRLSGKMGYRSGLRIDEGAEDFGQAIRKLATHGVIKLDAESLERKRERFVAPPIMKVVPTSPDISPDQVLLVQHAHARLKENTDEAQKWYSRAYFALRDSSSDPNRYPEDVLAVWEYLERTVPLPVVERVIKG
jgi:PilZ domain-containing protein